MKSLLNKFIGNYKKHPEFKLTQTRETFSFKPTINLDLYSKWMIGLTILEAYTSITEKNNKFELYKDLIDDLSFTELNGEAEETLGLSDISPKHLQDKILGPRNIQNIQKTSVRKKTLMGIICF